MHPNQIESSVSAQEGTLSLPLVAGHTVYELPPHQGEFLDETLTALAALYET